MAAPKNNKNGLGNSGGKSLQDRELAAAVRGLALTEIKNILELKTMTPLKQQVILKLAGTVLPRLNERSGPDSDSIPLKWMSSQSPISPGTGPKLSITA
jgi:hypothetical protein